MNKLDFLGWFRKSCDIYTEERQSYDAKSRVRKSHEIERISGGERRKSCGRERSGGLVMRAGQIMGYYALISECCSRSPGGLSL